MYVCVCLYAVICPPCHCNYDCLIGTPFNNIHKQPYRFNLEAILQNASPLKGGGTEEDTVLAGKNERRANCEDARLYSAS